MGVVLVSEDSRTQREIIARLLTEIGLTAIEASDGVVAWQKIQLHNPDLVVADIVCPGMNGYELCQKLKANPTTEDIPVVFCTVKTEAGDRDKGMKQGASGYIGKPFDPPELVETVVQLLLAGGKQCVHQSQADDWTEVGLMWLEDFENNQWAAKAFSKALELEPNHRLARYYQDIALGHLERSRPCSACKYYYGGSPGGNCLVCAVHPYGPEEDYCRDWESKYR